MSRISFGPNYNLRSVFISILLSFPSLTGCTQANSSKNDNVSATETPVVPVGWQYQRTEDKMRSTSSTVAELPSNNHPDLSFPYEGGSPVTLQLLELPKEAQAPDNTLVRLVLDNGQFDCKNYEGGSNCLITVKVNSEKPVDLRGYKQDCGSSECLELASDFSEKHGASPLSLIRHATHLTIEVPLYKYGEFQYDFSTADLRWGGKERS